MLILTNLSEEVYYDIFNTGANLDGRDEGNSVLRVTSQHSCSIIQYGELLFYCREISFLMIMTADEIYLTVTPLINGIVFVMIMPLVWLVRCRLLIYTEEKHIMYSDDASIWWCPFGRQRLCNINILWRNSMGNDIDPLPCLREVLFSYRKNMIWSIDVCD